MKPKECFERMAELIESGFTISQAIDRLGMDARTFYRTLTVEQRMELEQIRTSNRGIVHRGYTTVDTRDLHEFFTNDEYAV